MKTDKEDRNRKLFAYVTVSEMKSIREAADSESLSVSAFIRRSTLARTARIAEMRQSSTLLPDQASRN